MGSYFERLLQHAESHGTEEATVSPEGVLTYRDLVDRVELSAAALREAGVDERSIVGLTINDEVEHLIATLALLRAGAWQITLATHDPAPFRASLAARVGATHVLTDDPAAALRDIPTLSWPMAGTEGTVAPVDGGLFIRTSGTTGNSNIVPFPAEHIAVQAERNPEYATGRHLRLASIEHNNSKRHRLYCLYMGATNVFRPRHSYDLAEYAATQHVSCIDMSIMHASELAARPPAGLAGVSIRVGGAAVPYSVRRRLEEGVSPSVYVRYGSTETGTIAICAPGEHDEQETVGHPVAGLALQIVDERGVPLPQGVVGHIRLSGEGIASGYLDNPEQSAKRFRDGWFWPGDLGVQLPNGSLVVKGRSDEMLNLNGINIFPSEVERVLEAHEGVRAAAVAALKSGVHGDIPVAAVELVPGANVTGEQLMTYAKQHLALRAPRQIVVLETLPRNAQGKVLRLEVARIVDAARRNR